MHTNDRLLTSASSDRAPVRTEFERRLQRSKAIATLVAVRQVQCDLGWLLAPVEREAFFQTHWTKSPLRLSRNHEGAYYDHLFSKRDLENVVQRACQVPGAVEVLDANQRPRQCRSEAAAREFFRRGESIRVDGVHRFSRELTLFSRLLEEEFSCPVNINMYLSPGQTQALARHYDTHDVFVLQVLGRKKWKLFDSVSPYPLEYLPPLRCERQGKRTYRRDKRKDLTAQNTCSLTDEFVLLRGDLLYLPRGHWHEAETEEGQISCHLTVGAQAFTYLDLLTIAITQAAARNTDLRMPLPLQFATQSEPLSQVREHVKRILQALPGEVDAEAALSELAEVFVRSRSKVDDTLLPSDDTYQPNEIELDSSVTIRAGLVCNIVSTGVDVSFSSGTKKIILPVAFESAYRFMAANRSFTACDIPGDLTDLERLSLVRLFVCNGFLTKSSLTDTGGGGDMLKAKGWMPVRLTLKRSKPEIEWLYFGSLRLSEPFFKQTVSRLKNEGHVEPIKTFGSASLRQLQDVVQPSGFIFHVSRCGSTLLANALKSFQGTVVISEAQPFAELLAPRVSGSQIQDFDQQWGELFKGLVRAFGQRRTNEEQGLVIKFSSWSILSLALVRNLWPEVPCVVVIRNPAEVAVSCLNRAPGWLRLSRTPSMASRIFGWSEDDVKEMSREQFCARAIGLFLRSAAGNLSSNCRVVDYQNLKSTRILDVARFFGLDVNRLNRDILDKTLATYSKDPTGMRPFGEDQRLKQTFVTPTISEECGRWSDNAYAVLKEREIWMPSGASELS